MESKNKKYRLIEQINNAAGGNNKLYIIEKHKTFLFWSWWSQDYLCDPVFCNYESYNKEEMLNMMKILEGKKNWYDRKVIG